MKASLELKLPYKKLCGYITQTGEANPVLVLLENEFGSFTCERITEGIYSFVPEITGQFPVETTVIKPIAQDYGANQNIGVDRANNDYLQFASQDGGNSPADGVFLNNYFEILVYDKTL